MKTKKYFLYMVLALSFTFFYSCHEDEDNITPENDITNQDAKSVIESLVPDGYQAKKLNDSSNLKLNSSVFHYVEASDIKSEITQIKNAIGIGANLIIEVSNKQQRKLLNDFIAIIPEVKEKMGKLYILYYLDSEKGYRFSYYSEKNKVYLSEAPPEDMNDSIRKKSKISDSEIVTLSTGEIKSRIQKTFNKNLSTRKKYSKGGTIQIPKTQEYEYELYTRNKYRYNVILKIAKGKPKDGNLTGYGIHVQYLPQTGIDVPIATAGNRKYYGGGRCQKYQQTFTGIVGGITFKTTLTDRYGKPVDGIFKDNFPQAKVTESVNIARTSPSYSFTIGGKISGDVNKDGPKLGFDISGSYTYNSGGTSARVSTTDVYFINDTDTGVLGTTYFQNRLYGKTWVTKPRYSPLRNYNSGYRILIDGFVKSISFPKVNADSYLFQFNESELPAMSRSNTGPEHMNNIFISDAKANSHNNNINLKAEIFLDTVDLYAYQAPLWWTFGNDPCYAGSVWYHTTSSRHQFNINFNAISFFDT